MIGRIERVVRVKAVRWIGGIAGIIAVGRVKRIVGCVGLCRVQRVVWRIPIRGIEDVIVALVFLVETRFSERRDNKSIRPAG